MDARLYSRQRAYICLADVHPLLIFGRNKRMPNRIIKDSIWTSPNLNKLSAQAERHFYRVLLSADDYGCFESTRAVLKGKCYPLKLNTIKEKDIDKWQIEMISLDIIKEWEKEERIFAAFCQFDKHNSKYSVTEDGKPTRHRRRTPEPPQELLNETMEMEIKRSRNQQQADRLAAKNRRARQKGAEGSHTLEEWEKLKKEKEYTCVLCGKKEPEVILTQDHIIPLSMGGSNYIQNIQPLCMPCNRTKGVILSQSLPTLASVSPNPKSLILNPESQILNPDIAGASPAVQVFDFWNYQTIITHKQLSCKAKGKINALLAEGYTTEDILTAIENYAIILAGSEFYFTYKWGLADFLQRGFENFKNLDIAKNNYRRKTNNGIGKDKPEGIRAEPGKYDNIKTIR